MHNFSYKIDLFFPILQVKSTYKDILDIFRA